jgi:ApbE superfamily uncharacterized protein (UPF0280 family)
MTPEPAAPEAAASLRGDGERFYRTFCAEGGTRVPFRVCVETTDLYLRADRVLSDPAREAVIAARTQLEEHIAAHPEFRSALTPLEAPAGPLPDLLAAMYTAGQVAGVGPMAAVAGAVAEFVGQALRTLSREVLVENGGDLYLDVTDEVVVGLFAGESPFSGRVALRIRAADSPLAVCTSSGTVGPSLSYGMADAAVVVGRPTALADAVATALGNRIHSTDDLQTAAEWAVALPGIRGAVTVLGDRLAAAGAIEFVAAEP